MDQNLNNRQNELLYNLMANPASNGQAYLNSLQQLVKSFPQSGFLQALLAHANGAQNLQQAAAYFDTGALYKLINSPSSFPVVEEVQIFKQHSNIALKEYPHEDVVPEAPKIAAADVADAEPEEIAGDTVTDDIALEEAAELAYAQSIGEEEEPLIEVSENTAEIAEPISEEVEQDSRPPEDINEETAEITESLNGEAEQFSQSAEDVEEETAEIKESLNGEVEQFSQPAEGIKDETIEESESSNEEDIEQYSQPSDDIDEEIYDEIAAHGDVDISAAAPTETLEELQEDTGIEEEVQEEDITDEEENLSLITDEIDDEIYDEIVGIDDITIDHQGNLTGNESFTFASALSAEETEHRENEATAETKSREDNAYTFADNTLNLNDEAEKLIVGNIAATDYFMFDRAFTREGAETKEIAEHSSAETEKQDVSRYHDDKLPYSFLWWLDKTRREHAGINQPYVSFTPQTSAIENTEVDALQMQYFENIFHLTSVEELEKHTAQNVEFEVKHKGDEIVERFIKVEPQIKPPSSEKLDTENKAKKSAEDLNDLVTETLANIYADQMLYHKAIAIYNKLMLKFPEKSRYFADRIENLEKKTN